MLLLLLLLHHLLFTLLQILRGQSHQLIESPCSILSNIRSHRPLRLRGNRPQPLPLRVRQLLIRNTRSSVQIRAHKLLVQNNPTPELRQHQPRRDQQLRCRVKRDPRYHRPRCHLHQRHQRVQHPVRQPLLIILLVGALYRHDRRIQRIQQHHHGPRQGIAPHHDRPQPPHLAKPKKSTQH
ncbi:hypothetical protein M758_1G152400 [Ceratodon purpureus]|uniref:Secreted protein n=1 Tax=Ceratodon purpureus TaxID=3225 RepID=A0A8T0J8G8_CERPU|nr:hypothetical protein KC19_1G155700 [Ceratodon purpureus]KAG0630075.1 hypothetical protein M758_1G152400 [Ceratodon purpureus]